MIRAVFYLDHVALAGFRVAGHAGYADAGQDIVCASVSSAVMLAANLVTEWYHINARVTQQGDRIELQLPGPDYDSNGVIVLRGLHQHLQELSQQFPDCLKIVVSEVS